MKRSQNGRRAPAVLRTHKPDTPWVNDADLRHDEAIELGCPAFHGGTLKYVSISFTTEQMRDYIQRFDGGLVVEPELIRRLTEQYLMTTEIQGSPPEFVGDLKYPEIRFRKVLNRSFRKVSYGKVPGPVLFLTFFAVPKMIALGGNRNEDR